MQAIGPTASIEDAAGELIDDLHLSPIDEVLLVALVQLFGLQRCEELMDQIRVGRRWVVEVVETERSFDCVDTGLGGRNDSLLFVNVVVDVSL